MSATIVKSKATENGTFINTIAYQTIIEDEILGTNTIQKDWFYFESDSELAEGTDLPKFSPDLYNIRVSEYTTTDEETGEETLRVSKWLDGRKA